MRRFATTTSSNDTYLRSVYARRLLVTHHFAIQLTLSDTGFVNGWTNTSDLESSKLTGLNESNTLVRSGTIVTLYIDGTSFTTTYCPISPNSFS